MRDKITFVNFCHLSDDELLEILKLRNTKEIRMQMCNQEVITEEDHLRYCHALKESDDLFYYAVFFNSALVGVIDFKLKDRHERSYQSGAYFIKVPSQISTAAIQSALNICRHYDLRQDFILVRKENERALLFNIMKMKFQVISEDDQYCYLEGMKLTEDHPENLEWLEKNNARLGNHFDIEYRF